MSTILGPLYHWSPRERRKSILRQGLLPGRRNITGPVYNGPGCDDDGEPVTIPGEWRAPWVCLSPSPVRAWNYSHGAWRTTGTFDLWSVSLADTDEVHINPLWGDRIIEVRVHNRIPKSRLVWVGERTVS